MNNDKKIDYAIKLAKRLNQRYRALEKEKLQYFSYAYEKFRDITNLEKVFKNDYLSPTGYYTQSKKRLETFTDEQLEYYISILENQEKLKTSKIRHVRKIEEISYKKLKEKTKDIAKDFNVDITKKERDLLVKSGLLSLKELDSLQVIEDWFDAKSQGITINEFIETYGEFKDKFETKEGYSNLKKKLRKLRK